MKPSLRTLWWFLGIALLVLITALSLLPLSGPDIGLPNSDKLHHALAYVVLTLHFGQLTGTGSGRRLALVLGLVAYGVAIEGMQALMPPRSAELADVAANLAGIGIGLLLLPTAAGRLLASMEQRLARDPRL